MKKRQKIAIIGATEFQDPLIRKAQELGFETYVYAWKSDDIGEKTADHFIPISVIEKEKIYKDCLARGIGNLPRVSFTKVCILPDKHKKQE